MLYSLLVLPERDHGIFYSIICSNVRWNLPFCSPFFSLIPSGSIQWKETIQYCTDLSHRYEWENDRSKSSGSSVASFPLTSGLNFSTNIHQATQFGSLGEITNEKRRSNRSWSWDTVIDGGHQRHFCHGFEVTFWSQETEVWSQNTHPLYII